MVQKYSWLLCFSWQWQTPLYGACLVPCWWWGQGWCSGGSSSGVLRLCCLIVSVGMSRGEFPTYSWQCVACGVSVRFHRHRVFLVFAVPEYRQHMPRFALGPVVLVCGLWHPVPTQTRLGHPSLSCCEWWKCLYVLTCMISLAV